ncbi:hypothetical protein TELCIR_01653 [Teladorsagia circumcincta]|uniref:Uncharacterized protein n=1 Tax=Teladorsagia circumcincta TaxID=45464 RepID=A0A2G9V1C6_TELCI|nr:hypothetical protein TELCIR_01653 [Teladorsagia circumcincta]
MRSLFCYFIALLTVFYNILPVSSLDKKSDMSEFASAINGASRLRYGKRSFDDGYQLKLPLLCIAEVVTHQVNVNKLILSGLCITIRLHKLLFKCDAIGGLELIALDNQNI